MNSKQKKYRYLIPIILYYIVVTIIVNPFEYNIHTAMLWNLFLSAIPLLFASLVTKESIKLKPIWLVLWTIMLPNAFYMFTDLIHVNMFNFYIPTANNYQLPYNSNIMAWLGIIQIVFSVFLGVLFGLVAMRQVIRHYFEVGTPKYTFAVILVSFLNALGIYLGRFLRLYSWDIFKPMTILAKLSDMTVPFAVEFVGSYMMLIIALYYVYEFVVANRK